MTTLRERVLVDAPLANQGEYVLYWMTAQRRLQANFALDCAVAWARQEKVPLVIFEALRCDYDYACDRFHAFVIAGMRDHAARLHALGVTYVPYLEPTPGAGQGLLAALAQRARIVVVDDHPGALFRHQLARAQAQLAVRTIAVDSCGLLPLRQAPKAFARAFDFRRYAQKSLLDALDACPQRQPLRDPSGLTGARIDPTLLQRWPSWQPLSAKKDEQPWRTLAINHNVAMIANEGGAPQGHARLDDFFANKITRYASERQHPDANVESGLSPYLHFGQIGPHEIVERLVHAYGLPHNDLVPATSDGDADETRRWGLAAGPDAFLDQLLVWRELSFNLALHHPHCDTYESLPAWAKATLAAHQSDDRPALYDRNVLERAQTHDPLWNAAQRQLVTQGTIHNYLRMLWGKKILQWSATPQEAWETMVVLNDRYALDGRDPNSYAGIGWIFGRFDRPWAPQRPVFGAVRYMTSESAQRKLRLKQYLQTWGTHARSGSLLLFGDDPALTTT